jgi:hypothetical protein
VTAPKQIQDGLGVDRGERPAFEPQADRPALRSPASPRKCGEVDPFEHMKGSGNVGVTTEMVMCATRGADWGSEAAVGAI